MICCISFRLVISDDSSFSIYDYDTLARSILLDDYYIKPYRFQFVFRKMICCISFRLVISDDSSFSIYDYDTLARSILLDDYYIKPYRFQFVELTSTKN